MRTFSFLTTGLMAIVATFVITGVATAGEGIVRISDSPIQNTQTVNHTSYSNSHYHYSGDVYCDECNNHPCECRKRCCEMYPADAGWGRPVRNPIHRIPVSYLKRWPDAVHGIKRDGRAPVYPMVYQPNDTTHLGFTYQSVPQWQPNPAMVPPMPWPSQWHSRECGYKNCNCQQCQNGHAGGEIIYQSSEPTPIAPIESQPENVEPQKIPPAPPAAENGKSASRSSNFFRKRSLRNVSQ